MPTPVDVSAVAPAILAALGMLLTAAFFAARRAREWACACLPDSGFRPFYDALR